MQNYNNYSYKIPASPLFPQRELIYMPECHSTNAYLEQMVREREVAEGSVVIAGYQYAGKGQRGNLWLTEPGQNLTFSVLLKPFWLQASQQMYLTRVFALGITDWLKTLMAAEVHIKWPNDVLLNRRKVCGILIENQLHREHIAMTIGGIGVNINQAYFPFASATSLFKETGREYNLDQCFYDLMVCLDRRYAMLQRGMLGDLHNDYLAQLFGLGMEINFSTGNSSFPGTVLGVDDYGRLEVRTPWGIRLYGFKETTIQWPLK
ncbi:MAG: biotin--[acetyl-CoA-carboxylase] ligase [Cyclobacteriaceae bacterium]|nr:MAG: biotin--[acetyl-CoA-carboxylase] ligase [Cyclobacteriaceae bacterium]